MRAKSIKYTLIEQFVPLIIILKNRYGKVFGFLEFALRCLLEFSTELLVARLLLQPLKKDYLFNELFEFFYLPISFDLRLLRLSFC